MKWGFALRSPVSSSAPGPLLSEKAKGWIELNCMYQLVDGKNTWLSLTVWDSELVMANSQKGKPVVRLSP
jgi:hypothetical protein